MEASPKKKTYGKKFVTCSTLETDLKDYYDLLISLGTVSRAQCAVSCPVQESSIRCKRMQALATHFARMICEPYSC